MTAYVDQPFEANTEAWNEYRLSDGTLIRVKCVITHIAVGVNLPAGDVVRNGNGELLVRVTSHVIVTAPRVVAQSEAVVECGDTLQ